MKFLSCFCPRKKVGKNDDTNNNDEDNDTLNRRLLAAQFGNEEELRELCVNNNNNNINYANSADPKSGISPLHAAVIGSQLEVVRILVEEMNADTTQRCTVGGRIPLHNACARSTAKVVQLLLEANPKTINMLSSEEEDGQRRTPLDFACDWARKDIEDLLRRNGGKRATEL
eukprot:CAMPEP_0194158014 /NCGR_PEP_ID=MMETSP0152-20130528/74295_1 /TAXON_ID=1049557 /ORGANISM="Thalassiothrix antarctica, Strain L6-D1" /LENGTH=171 /DNA_ID=CAMNT_0038866887 /DNA_START=69 /DNA_END=584 /DNA_ORIENTATION=-